MQKSIKVFLFYLILFINPNNCLSTEIKYHITSIHSGYYLNSFPDISIKDMETALRFWLAEVTKEAGIIGKTFVYDDLISMRTDFYQGKLDFVVASPLVFINQFDLNLLADGFKVAPYGKSKENLVLITQKQAESFQFTDLKNHRLSLLANDPVSQMYINTLTLEHFGQKASHTFSSIRYFHQSSILIYELFFNKTDAILVYKEAYVLAVELNPQIKKQTQIIAEIKDIPRGLSFFHQRMDPDLREWIISQALIQTGSPRRQQLLALFKSNSIERATLNDLKSVQQLKKRYLKLIQQHGSPQ